MNIAPTRLAMSIGSTATPPAAVEPPLAEAGRWKGRFDLPATATLADAAALARGLEPKLAAMQAANLLAEYWINPERQFAGVVASYGRSEAAFQALSALTEFSHLDRDYNYVPPF